MVKYLWWGSNVFAAIESVLEVVSNEIARLQKQIDVVGGLTCHVVGGRDPGGVLWRRPIQLRHNFATEVLNGRGDGVVKVSPLCSGIRVVVFGV